jgi:signal transduction histidine kinase
MQLLWGISAASALMISIIIWLLIKRVSRPVAELGSWARRLDSSNSGKAVPDFGYPELNRLAELIRASVSSVQQSVEREQRFLRHASHELRTPISVIRSNVELIKKLHDDNNGQAGKVEALAYERIDRASLNMQHMTETLLWLSRDELEVLPTRNVEIGSLIENLVDETRYLLAEKDVRVNVLTDSYVCELSTTALRIVLGNLIRNAFQHTWDGEVSIVQCGHTVQIENRSDDAGNRIDNDATGFGLGLQLTEQLTQRLHWKYRNLPITGGRLVELKLGS